MRTMGFERVAGVLITVHGAQDPTDAEWNAFLEHMHAHSGKNPRGFAYSIGGGPNSKQRKALFAAMGQRHLPVALVSTSRVALAIGVAVSWFNSHLKAYAPAQLRSALRHLSLDERETQEVLRVARQLAKELGIARAAQDLELKDAPSWASPG
jgi:hypothetical protein